MSVCSTETSAKGVTACLDVMNLCTLCSQLGFSRRGSHVEGDLKICCKLCTRSVLGALPFHWKFFWFSDEAHRANVQKLQIADS